MLNLLTRHYKRLGLFAFGMGCVTLSVVSRLGLGLGQIDHLVIFAFSLLAYTWLGLLLCRLKPRRRAWLEIAGVSGILTTLVVIYFNRLSGNALPAVIGFLGCFAGLNLLLRGRLSRVLGNKITWRARHSIDLAFPPKLVWKHCVPGAGAPQDHCTGVFIKYEQSAEDEDTIRTTFAPRQHGQAWYDITFLERDKPRFCRLYFEGEEADGTLVDGVFTIAIEVTDKRASTLIVHEERNGLSLFDLMERWFDDALAYHNEKLRDMLQARYGDGEGVTKPLPQAAE